MEIALSQKIKQTNMLYTLTGNINLYRSIFENNALGIAIHDINLNIVEVNSAFCRLLGYTEGELLHLNLSDLTPEKDMSRIHKNVENFRMSKHNVVKINRPYIRKDGSMLYVNTDVNAVRDSIGNIEFFILSVRDNNKYKITHQALLQTEKRYQILFENSLIGISIWDPVGYLIEANPAFYHLLSYTEEELSTKKVLEIIAPSDRKSSYLYITQLRSGELPGFHTKRKFLTKHGEEILCDVSIKGVYDKENNYTGAIVATQNINETAKQDRIIWKLNKAMQKSGRAYARLEGAVHIVSENLQSQVKGLTDFTTQIASDIPHQQFIEALQIKAQTINNTLESLLNYTNIQAQNVKLEATNMQKLVHEVLSNFNDIECVNITTQDLPEAIEIDKNKIAQLLHQLLDNAFKFSAPDKSLNIHVKVEEQTDYWVCTVSDNGIGIPENDRYHIFLPFKQLDTNAEGAGIGLAICKTIIEQHQGKIFIASEPEDGYETSTCFFIPKTIA